MKVEYIVKRPYQKPQLAIFGSLSLVTRGSGGSTGDANSMMVQSDRRLKENLVAVDQHPLGFGLYIFDYIPALQGATGHNRKFGVVAQEVEPIVPEAVVTGPDGYKRVDYARLGIRLGA